MANPMRAAMKILNKVSQMASGGDALISKLPNTDILCHLSKLSIKLQDQDAVLSAISRFVFQKSVDFDPILFTIKDRLSDTKQVVLHAALCARKGFVLCPDSSLIAAGNGQCPSSSDNGGFVPERDIANAIMVVTLPVDEGSSYGKIEHPCGATVYKMSTADQHKRMNIVRAAGAASDCEHHGRLLAVAHCRSNWRRKLLKQIGLTFTKQKVDIVQPRTGKLLGKIRPKAGMVRNDVLHVTFTSDACGQCRAAVLALALFKLLELAPHNTPVRNLLRESIYHPEQDD